MVKKAYIFLLGAVLPACNPYEPYFYTHYHMQAEMDPVSARISANVQMVFVARQPYSDSVVFYLNPNLEIQSLAAQELKHFRFYGTDTGRLVLYIEGLVNPHEQLHVSMSYSGCLSQTGTVRLDSSLLWYPVNEDTRPSTFLAKLAIPGNWRVSYPEASTGRHGKWLLQAGKPQSSLDIELQMIAENRE